VNYAELLDYSDSQFCHIAELNKANKKLEKRIAELEELSQMIIDAESADAPLIPIMFHTWLHKAKALEQGK